MGMMRWWEGESGLCLACPSHLVLLRVNVDIRDIVKQCRETGATQDVSMTLHILKVPHRERIEKMQNSMKREMLMLI